jgi:predicted RNA methylase
MSSSEYPDYVPRNVEVWTKANAEHTARRARDAWAKDEIDWGIFGIAESQLDVLGDVAGLDVVELGCGTAYFSAWLAKRGARPVGVDPTPAQLATAREMLRPWGRLIFLRNSTILVLCQTMEPPVGEQLQRPQFGLHRIDWPDTGEVEFHLGHGDWIDLLRASGFDVERMIELYAPDNAVTHGYYNYVTPEWARKWPAEEIWVARKRG